MTEDSDIVVVIQTEVKDKGIYGSIAMKEIGDKIAIVDNDSFSRGGNELLSSEQFDFTIPVRCKKKELIGCLKTIYERIAGIEVDK